MPPLGQFGRRAQGPGGCGLQAHGLSQFGLQARAPRGITFMAKT